MAEISPNWNALYSNQGIRFNGNPGLDDLRQTYATQQAQKAQDNANFTAQIAKLNFGGAKDADLDYLHKQYGDILNTFGQLRNTNDSKQRAQLGLQLQQKQNGFLFDIEKSKDANKQFMEAAHLPLNPNANLTADAPDKIAALGKKSSFDHDYQKTYQDTVSNLFDKPVDLAKIYNDAFTNTKSESKSTGDPIKDKLSGEFKTPTYSTTDVKPEDFKTNILTQLKGDKKKQEAVVKAYPTLSHDDAIKQFITDGYNMQKNKMGTDTTYSQPFESFGQKEALQKNSAILRQTYSTGASNQITPFQVSANQLQKIGQQNSAAAKDYLKHMVDIIPTKGLKEPIRYNVDENTGHVVIDVPRKHTSNTSFVSAHRISIDLADPNFGTTLQEKLAAEGANINGFNQSFRGKQVPVPTTQPVKFTPTIENGISNFMKANKLSRDEAIKILKENGKL